jgi:hypothetical protein
VRLRFPPVGCCRSAVFTSSDSGPALVVCSCGTTRVAVVDTRSCCCTAQGQVALLQHTSARMPALQGQWRRCESLAIQQHDLTHQLPVAACVVSRCTIGAAAAVLQDDVCVCSCQVLRARLSTGTRTPQLLSAVLQVQAVHLQEDGAQTRAA